MPRPAAALASPDEHDVFQDEPPVLPPEFQISSHHLYRKRTAAAARRALLPIPVTPMSGNGKAPHGPNFLLPARAGDAILFQRLLNARKPEPGAAGTAALRGTKEIHLCRISSTILIREYACPSPPTTFKPRYSICSKAAPALPVHTPSVR